MAEVIASLRFPEGLGPLDVSYPITLEP